MQATRRATLTGVLGLSLLGVPFLRLAWNQPAALARIEGRPMPRWRRDAAEEMLRQARRWRTRAIIAVNRDQDVLEAWDPAGSAATDDQAWRATWLAADPTGDLRRAMSLVQQAAARARSPGDEYDVAELLVIMDHERGDHEAAVEQARRLVALRPGSVDARMVFRQAERRAACDRVSRSSGPAPAARAANTNNRGLE